MIVVLELDRNSELERLAVSYETIYLRLRNNLKPEEIISCGDNPYYAMKEDDKHHMNWYLLMFNKGRVPRSVRRVCDDRCLLDDSGITWMRRGNHAMWEGIGRLYSYEDQKKKSTK